MSEKKVVVFIVEGPSDEAALGTIMKEYFSSNEVQFIVVHGDITLKDYVSGDNILNKINEQIEGVKSRKIILMKRSRYCRMILRIGMMEK